MNMNVNLTHSVTRFTLIWVFCLLFSTTTALRLRTVTFNTGGILRDTTPFNNQLSRQLPDLLSDQDVVIFNFQEVYEQKAISAIINSARFNKKTVNNALEENFINLLIPEDERANYTVQSHFCFAFLTLIVARNSFLGDNGIDLYSETIHVDVFNEGAYHGGHWGGFFLSKGGFSILISLGDLRIININCHLNSKNKKKREEEWNALKTTLIKYYYRTLYGTDNDGDLAENHDNLDRQANLIWLWSGDFNPRFDKKDLTAIKHNVKQFYLEDDDLNNPDLLNAPLTLDEEHDYIEWLPKLLRFDEFILRREKNNRELEGLASDNPLFYKNIHLNEEEITFKPTYKFIFYNDDELATQLNEPHYNQRLKTDKKIAWTDRVFYGSSMELRIGNYKAWVDFVCSDHKPVSLDFDIHNDDLRFILNPVDDDQQIRERNFAILANDLQQLQPMNRESFDQDHVFDLHWGHIDEVNPEYFDEEIYKRIRQSVYELNRGDDHLNFENLDHGRGRAHAIVDFDIDNLADLNKIIRENEEAGLYDQPIDESDEDVPDIKIIKRNLHQKNTKQNPPSSKDSITSHADNMTQKPVNVKLAKINRKRTII